MIYTKPDFYDEFKCKADKCIDTCCAGWEVDIDADTLEKYKSIDCSFGERLKENINIQNETASFALTEKARCVFLAESGLCDIYSKLGEGYLCEICREHPRFYDFFDGIIEIGLGLCCEKVCEMLFSTDAPVEFVSFSDGDEHILNEEDLLYFKLRQECFNILKNREMSLNERIKALLNYIVTAQNEHFSDSFELKDININQLFSDVVSIFEKTEPINADWTDFVLSLKRNASHLRKTDINESEYEQILTYILYRHFMQSRFTGNVIAPVTFAVTSIVFIYLCDCMTFSKNNLFSANDRIDNVKLWSKQIEYSEENTALLLRKTIELFVI